MEQAAGEREPHREQPSIEVIDMTLNHFVMNAQRDERRQADGHNGKERKSEDGSFLGRPIRERESKGYERRAGRADDDIRFQGLAYLKDDRAENRGQHYEPDGWNEYREHSHRPLLRDAEQPPHDARSEFDPRVVDRDASEMREIEQQLIDGAEKSNSARSHLRQIGPVHLIYVDAGFRRRRLVRRRGSESFALETYRVVRRAGALVAFELGAHELMLGDVAATGAVAVRPRQLLRQDVVRLLGKDRPLDVVRRRRLRPMVHDRGLRRHAYGALMKRGVLRRIVVVDAKQQVGDRVGRLTRRVFSHTMHCDNGDRWARRRSCIDRPPRLRFHVGHGTPPSERSIVSAHDWTSKTARR